MESSLPGRVYLASKSRVLFVLSNAVRMPVNSALCSDEFASSRPCSLTIRLVNTGNRRPCSFAFKFLGSREGFDCDSRKIEGFFTNLPKDILLLHAENRNLTKCQHFKVTCHFSFFSLSLLFFFFFVYLVFREDY